MTKILVTFLEPISAPYGTYLVDDFGKFLRWKYCVQIDGRWYFALKQKAGDAN